MPCLRVLRLLSSTLPSLTTKVQDGSAEHTTLGSTRATDFMTMSKPRMRMGTAAAWGQSMPAIPAALAIAMPAEQSQPIGQASSKAATTAPAPMDSPLHSFTSPGRTVRFSPIMVA